jgi:pyridoxine kinase
MAIRVLAISSQVAYGTVGNSAAVPAMEALGLVVHTIPTIILSNHPGLGAPAGVRIEARNLGAILSALENLGVLRECAAVLTGYFAANDQIHGVARAIQRMKEANPSLTYLCDPILGDDPNGLYVPPAVAEAIRDELVPLATCIAPNRFELEWLSGKKVASAENAISAARSLACAEVLATSIPIDKNSLNTLLIDRHSIQEHVMEKRTDIPHGTGDALSGLFLGYRLLVQSAGDAFVAAMRQLEKLVLASQGNAVLDLHKGLK